MVNIFSVLFAGYKKIGRSSNASGMSGSESKNFGSDEPGDDVRNKEFKTVS